MSCPAASLGRIPVVRRQSAFLTFFCVNAIEVRL